MSVDAWEENRLGVVTLGAPSGYLHGERGELTAEQVRAYAAELFEAADVLERIAAKQ